MKQHRFYRCLDWDVYWRGTHENAAHQEGGPQEEVLAEFWQQLFQQHLAGADEDRKRVLDLACGNGAVTGFAHQAAPSAMNYCLDFSVSAVLELQKRYPRSGCVAADALRTPFTPGSFDLVCSQFGIEYAGLDTIGEAAGLVAPGGVLALVLHLHSGAIYDECAQNLRAINAIRDIELLPLARTAFSAGFALNAGVGSVAAFKSAEKDFTPAVRGLEGILRELGPAVAASLARQLYRDISHMYRNMSAFDKGEVTDWVDGMGRELDAYGGRMSSMLAAALDGDALDKMKELAQARGLRVTALKTLAMGSQGRAAAWVLVAQRDG